MTNQERFIQTFGIDAWQQMIVFSGLAERFKEYWTSPYKKESDEYETAFVTGDILHSVNEAYNKGLNDAWNLAKKIVLPSDMDGYTVDEIYNIFGKNTYMSVFMDFTSQEALAKVKAYEEKRNEIKVGDVVTIKGGISDFESIVTKVAGRVVYRLFMDGSCDGHAYKEDLVKTGKHFDSIDEFMRLESEE